MPIDALSILWAQPTRDLFAIAKFLFLFSQCESLAVQFVHEAQMYCTAYVI